jgi:hypothetical protein
MKLVFYECQQLSPTRSSPLDVPHACGETDITREAVIEGCTKTVGGRSSVM